MLPSPSFTLRLALQAFDVPPPPLELEELIFLMGALFSNGGHRLEPTSAPLSKGQLRVPKSSLFSRGRRQRCDRKESVCSLQERGRGPPVPGSREAMGC